MRSVKEIIDLLKILYSKEFGGKKNSRYFISTELFKDIAGRKRIEDSIKTEIINGAYEEGLIVTELEDGYSVIESDVMNGYRKATKATIAELLKPAKSKT